MNDIMAEGGHGRRKKSEFVLSMSNVCSVSYGTVPPLSSKRGSEIVCFGRSIQPHQSI